MGAWIKVDDSPATFAEIHDPIYRRVVTLDELRAQRDELLSAGVKSAPDDETLALWNSLHGFGDALLIVKQLEQDIAEIEALE